MNHVRSIFDPFLLSLFAAIGLASLLHARGTGLDMVSAVSNIAIFLLFFFHGLRLSRSSVWEAMKNWPVQLAIFCFVFAAMPLAGWGAMQTFRGWLGPALWQGVVFLVVLPSTVQSAIASSSLAGGNVAASVVAAALTNLASVVLTPLLLASNGVGLGGIGRIALLLLLPFALGQIMQFWLRDWAERHRRWISRMDRLTIILAVYVAFSAAVNEGLWTTLAIDELMRLTIIICLLLGFGFGGAWLAGRALGLSHDDRTSLLFAGAHKSLATGAPMARIIFPASQAGLILIPLMIYHQLQLIASAIIATRMARKGKN